MSFVKTSMSSLHFQRLQCLLYIFKYFNVFCQDFNAFFTFQRLQCLLSRLQCLLYISKTSMSSFTFQKTSMSSMSSFTFQKTSMSSVSYTFKRLQCLHLHFKRLQCLQSFTLSKDYNVFIYISKTSMSFVFYRTRRPLFLCFEKKTSDVFRSTELQCSHVSRFHFLGFHQLPGRIASSLEQN